MLPCAQGHTPLFYTRLATSPIYFPGPFPQRPISHRLSYLALALAIAGGLALLPRTVLGQADTTVPQFQASFKIPGPALRAPLPLRVPGLGSGLSPAQRGVFWDSLLQAGLDSARASWTLAYRYLSVYGEGGRPRQNQPPRRRGTFGLPSDYANLSIDGTARIELRTDRVRNERCTPAALRKRE